MRGRKRKPTALKILAGKPGHRPLPKDEPKPTGKAVMPAWLSPEGQAVWRDLAPVTEKLGLLTDHDSEQFGVLCSELAEYRKSPNEMPTTTKTLIKTLFAEFGMGPAARTRIQVKPSEGQNDENRFFA